MLKCMTNKRLFSQNIPLNNANYFNGQAMSGEDAWKLNEAQISFEQDRHNAQRAYEYFIELNKHQFFLNVVNCFFVRGSGIDFWCLFGFHYC